MEKLFLVRYPEKPVLVPDKKPTVIGRSDQCDILLAESRVSRRHASIEWQKANRAYVLRDLGSSNGTYLNTSRIDPQTPSALKDWDKIRVASAVFSVRIVDNPASIMNEFDELRDHDQGKRTEIFSVHDLTNPLSTPALAGDLSHLCPVELFQMLESGHKSGTLSITTPRGTGSFAVADGQLVRARYLETSGEQAVFATLNDTAGTFTFKAEQVPFDRTEISLSTTFLLMEGCRLMDEANASPKE